MKHLSEEFHGHVGSIALLKDGRSVKIVGGEGFKLFVKDVDGKIFECYHDQLETIFAE